MSFFGKKYVLDSQENFEAFVESFGSIVPDDVKTRLINHKGTFVLSKDGDQYTFSSSSAVGNDRSLTFKSGVEFVEEINPTLKASTTITIDGNTMTQVQKTDNGTVTTKRVFSDNQVDCTITSSGFSGVAKRTYKPA